jgi:DNA-binding GntR family transcriptional regulator
MGHNEPPPADTSQVARIYEEIIKIIYGRYQPGMNISEATLARVFGASRTDAIMGDLINGKIKDVAVP